MIPVFTEKASAAWRKSFAKFEDLTSFEVMYQENIDTGEMTAQQVWDANIAWLESLLDDASNIATPSEDEEKKP